MSAAPRQKRAAKALPWQRVALLLLALVALVATAPPTLALPSPTVLALRAWGRDLVLTARLAPGDTITRTVQFHNGGSRPVGYELGLTRSGMLWSCDPAGYNLDYEVAWSEGADMHLLPGETEVATVTLRLPLAAGNACQGKVGMLLVRRRYLEEPDTGGEAGCHRVRFFFGRQRDSDPADQDACRSIDRFLNRILGCR